MTGGLFCFYGRAKAKRGFTAEALRTNAGEGRRGSGAAIKHETRTNRKSGRGANRSVERTTAPTEKRPQTARATVAATQPVCCRVVCVGISLGVRGASEALCGGGT